MLEAKEDEDSTLFLDLTTGSFSSSTSDRTRPREMEERRGIPSRSGSRMEMLFKTLEGGGEWKMSTHTS